MATPRRYAQLQAFTLAGSGSVLAATSITLTSFNDIEGNALTMDAFGSKGYGTLEPGSASQEEQMSFTGITNNADGSVTLTGVSNVDFLYPYTETSGLTKIHAGGVRFVISNTSGFYGSFANKLDDETITGDWTFSTTPEITNLPVANTDAANKEYVDNSVTSGAPNANETTKGIVQLATSAQTGAGTSVGSTGARLVAPNSLNTNTSAGAGNAGFLPVLNASGLLSTTFLPDASTTAKGVGELATNAELAAGTASGSSGPLVATGSSFNATPSAAPASDSNKVPVLGTTGVLDQRFIDGVGTSGEAFSVGDALYLKASDGKLYKTIATGDESTFSFVGIAQTTVVAADASARFARPGQIALGLTGLTAGSYYYLTNSFGTLNTSPGDRFAKVGQAMSTTTLRVIDPKFVRSGTVSISAATTFDVTTGFYPAHIDIYAAPPVTTVAGISVGNSNNTCVAAAMLDADNYGIAQSKAWYNFDTNTNILRNQGIVSNRTATNFTLTCETYQSTVTVVWTAFSE